MTHNQLGYLWAGCLVGTLLLLVFGAIADLLDAPWWAPAPALAAWYASVLLREAAAANAAGEPPP